MSEEITLLFGAPPAHHGLHRDGRVGLPAEAAAELEAARTRLAGVPDGARLVRMLRGGFWRNFLVKYPEVADAYWKMLRLSGRVADGLPRRPGDPSLLPAREELWRGQSDDACWHGVFGGRYLPHLRRAVRDRLLRGSPRRARFPLSRSRRAC